MGREARANAAKREPFNAGVHLSGIPDACFLTRTNGVVSGVEFGPIGVGVSKHFRGEDGITLAVLLSVEPASGSQPMAALSPDQAEGLAALLQTLAVRARLGTDSVQ